MSNNKYEELKSTISRELQDQVELTAKQVMDIEAILTIKHKISPELKSKKAYLLLCGYYLLSPKDLDEKAFLLQQARMLFRNYSSKLYWNKCLDKYKKLDQSVCMYKVGDETLELNDNINATLREDIYLNQLKEVNDSKRKIQVAGKGKYSFYLNGKICNIVFEEKYGSNDLVVQSKKQRKPIEISIDELLQTAYEMNKQLPGDHCYDNLKKNTIKEVVDNRVEPCTKFKINQMVNMIGMVGAGKTTFMKVLSVYASKKHIKTVLVLNTNKDVFDMYSYFKKMNLNVVPLIGMSKREEYIASLLDEHSLFLDEDISKYLTNICLLEGSNASELVNLRYGDEPCFKLKRDNNSYACPFYDVCPTMAMHRDAKDADIIVTTVAGIAAIRTGKNHGLFLKEVIEQADIVLFDECDSVQVALDDFFAPHLNFRDYIIQQADSCAENMKKASADENLEVTKYYELKRNSLTIYNSLKYSIKEISKFNNGAARDVDITAWKNLVTSTFSSLSAWELLCNQKFDSKLTQYLLRLIIGNGSNGDMDNIAKLARICINAGRTSDNSQIKEEVYAWLRESNIAPFNENEMPDGKTKKGFLLQCICLVVKLIAFDWFMADIDSTYDNIFVELENPSDTLADFFQARYVLQQQYLPTSPMGNVFGIQYSEKGDMKIYRQYAYGRILMNALPYLRIDEYGNPLGPHTILLSGSSFVQGSLQYHVNQPVNYILESPMAIREFLNKAKFTPPSIGNSIVSGSKSQREENLKKLIAENSDNLEAELERTGKILFIVNNYEETITAAEATKTVLKNINSEVTCARLVRSGEKMTKDKIPRGEVYKFNKHPARILIAPAAAIERGYNIVDEHGHSSFGSVFYLVRPMPVPDYIGAQVGKMNGYIYEKFHNQPIGDYGHFASDIRNSAGRYWHSLQEQTKGSLSMLTPYQKRDVVATVFTHLEQIYGRAARVTDLDKTPPRIYFVDGAFCKHENQGFDYLSELMDYLDSLMSGVDGEIAKTLYGTFYEAIKKGGIGYERRKGAEAESFENGEYSFDELYSQEFYD